MKILKYVLYTILSFVILFALFLLYATITDYTPEERIILFESEHPDTIKAGSTLSLLTWNIGYAGLGENMSFFYDGGTQVRDTRENTLSNLSGIIGFLTEQQSIPFVFLQEVDKKSKRSYKIDQTDRLGKKLNYKFHFFALNYKSFFVPIPPLKPMGKVCSGLFSMTRFEPYLIERYDFPGNYSWPTKLFFLDRCFMVLRFAVDNNKSLLLINTHNSAFDDGSLKKHEMEYFRDFILKEMEAGNYIIAGGDWNQNPPGFVDDRFNDESGYENFVLRAIRKDFLNPDWSWVYDPSTSTNRSLTAPYNSQTSTTILDFFLISPNVTKLEVKTTNMNFKFADHHPVFVSVKLE